MRVDGVVGGVLPLTETAEELAVVGDDMFTEEEGHLSGCIKEVLMMGVERWETREDESVDGDGQGGKKRQTSGCRYVQYTRKGKYCFLASIRFLYLGRRFISEVTVSG